MTSKVVSVAAMVKRCAGLIGTKDVNEKTDGFLRNVVERTRNGEDTSVLTSGQLEWLDDIHERHFA